MHPYRGKLHMDRQSDGLSTRPDDSNTLTRQYAVDEDSPRDPLLGPITGGKFSSRIKVIKPINPNQRIHWK